MGDTLDTVAVPEQFEPIFRKAQEYVSTYFRKKKEDATTGKIEVFGQRYILVRAASMSVDFFDTIKGMFKDWGEDKASEMARSLLFDVAHAIGKMDARNFHQQMGLQDPIEKLSAGPIHFSHTGWAFVDISAESKPTADENYYLIYDHPFSFEADAWEKSGKKSSSCVCAMNAGYSSGWCEESFGIPLVASEIMCRARGDSACRFIMAQPSKIAQFLREYLHAHPEISDSATLYNTGGFLQRFRQAQEELQNSFKLLEKTNSRLLQEIAQRKKAEESLENFNADLESTVSQLTRSNRQLHEFAHLTAHDLKTPLRGIGTLAQWLATDYYDKFDDNGRRQIKLLLNRIWRVDKIMDVILQYSTIARDKHKERSVDLNEPLNDALLQIRPPRNIKITIRGRLPALICDEKHIYEVFYNLIGNAVRFIDKPEGRVIIDCAEEENHWKFSVSDNGPGIEPQYFSKIFQLFQTLCDRDESQGVGAGLAITKKIIELYDGKVWLVSEPGQGSTFYFTWPKAAAVTRPIPQPATA
jgi:two-component system cell cycle sensor histidine kinase/response regulator CckA